MEQDIVIRILQKLNLQIKIGEMTVVSDLGEYLNALYKWLMVAGFTFAIVMTMIGGLQYVISAGSGGSSEGKKRITNGVTGLILLFCVYLILYTVNPYLVKLQVPKLPMIKTIVLATGDSCENMIKAGYTVDAGDKEKKCGTIGKVTKAPEDKQVSDGTTCDFTSCTGSSDYYSRPSSAKCATATNPFCVQCDQIWNGNMDKFPGAPEPGNGLCAGLSDKPEFKPDGTTLQRQNICFFTRDMDVLFVSPTIDPGIATLNSVVTLGLANKVGAGVSASSAKRIIQGVCANLDLNCSKVSKCEDYDNLNVESLTVKKAVGNTTNLEELETGIMSGTITLKSVCESNPCNISDGAHGQNEICKYDGPSDSDWNIYKKTYKKLKNDCVPRWNKK